MANKRFLLSVDEHFDVSYDTKVVVQETGICHYAAPVIFKSSCKIDVTWFPFDYQTCELKFGSWTYDGLEVRFFIQFIFALSTLHPTNCRKIE